VVVAISRAKVAFIHEPLVFADLAFIADIFRYPKLFYTNFLGPQFLATVIGILGAIIAAWFYFEPHMLPKAGRVAALRRLPFCPSCVSRWSAGRWRSRPFRTRIWMWRATASWSRSPGTSWPGGVTTGRGGSSAGSRPSTCRWRERKRSRPLSSLSWRNAGPSSIFAGSTAARWRCRTSIAPARAAAWGMLETPIGGGYTMRSEFAVLTGRKPQDIGFDRYYPYLNSAAYGEHALAAALRYNGYQTAFIATPIFSGATAVCRRSDLIAW